MKPEELKEARRALDLTQDQLAHQLDLELNTISRYETGKQDIPRVVDYAIRYLRHRSEV